MNSEQILIYNTILYLLSFLYFFIKEKYTITCKNFLFACLSIFALSSYLFYIQPGFIYTVHYSEMTIFPFIYLYAGFMLLLTPYRKLNNKAKEIILLNEQQLDKFINIVLPFILFILICFILLILQKGLVTDINESRNELYEEGVDYGILQSNWIFSTILRLYNISYVSLLCLSFYCLIFTKKNFKIWCFIISPYVISFASAIYTSTRAQLFFIILFIIFQRLLYTSYISKKQKRVFNYITFFLGSLIGTFLIAVSLSRFKDAASLYMYKYAGESMINFNGLLFNNIEGTTNGLAYFAYIPNKLGFIPQLPYNTLNEKWDFIENTTGVSGQFFYTIIGAFIFEIGKTGTFILLIIANLFLRKKFNRAQSGKKLILVSFITYQIIAGFFLFNAQGDQGNLSIILFIILYLWLKNQNNKVIN